MRIAHLTQCYPPAVSGAAIFARQLAEGMARLGHQVMVIAPSGDGIPRVAQQGNLTLISLRSFHNPLRVRQRFVPGPRRRILHALTGSGEAGAMSDAIRRILTDAKTAGAMSVASRRLAENHAHFETVDQYERMYNAQAGREPVMDQPKISRRDRLYNWLAAIVHR